MGAVFLLVGVLGFIPGITSDFDQISFASHDSGAKLLGIFQISILHNVVHCSSAWRVWPWHGLVLAPETS